MTQSPSRSNKKNKGLLSISIGVIAAFLISYFIWPIFHEFINEGFDILTSGDEKRISTWVKQAGFWGPLMIILLMIVQTFLLVIPTPLVMIVSVLAYGGIWGTLINIAGVFIASTIGYVIGALLGRVTVNKLVGKKTQKKLEKLIENYGFWAVIVARISPLFSNDATSFAGGLLRMGYWKFIAATLAGIIPLAIAIAYLGSDIDRLKSGLIWISVIGLLALAGYIFYDKKWGDS